MYTKEEYNEFLLKYNYALKVLETNIRILLSEYERNTKTSVVDHIKTRIKSEESSLKKLSRKGYEQTLDNFDKHVHDIVGLRIVCPFLSDVYEVVELIKSSELFKIIEEKDYIKNPKDTGYISYHLVVLVPVPIGGKLENIQAEIQVRTMAMDFWASIDHKLQYKFVEEVPENIKDELYRSSVDIQHIDEKMLELKELIKDYEEQ